MILPTENLNYKYGCDNDGGEIGYRQPLALNKIIQSLEENEEQESQLGYVVLL